MIADPLDGDGAVVGFCLASVNEDDWVTMGASSAYIELIGVVRAHRGRRVAPAVITGTLAAIAAAGLERAVLFVGVTVCALIWYPVCSVIVRFLPF